MMASAGVIDVGAPLFVWVELEPLTFWLDLAAAVDILLLSVCRNSTSGISLNGACSKPLMILGRFWVAGWCWAEIWRKVSSPGRKRCLVFWVASLGSFLGLEHDARQMLEFNSRRLLNPKHEGGENTKM
jgi:hypothetical protein